MDDHGAAHPVRDGVADCGAPFTDAELTRLALSADPDALLDEDAVPMTQYLGQGIGLLPEWYMPAPVLSTRGWRVPVVLGIVVAFVVIEALGLCSTFGQLVPN